MSISGKKINSVAETLSFHTVWTQSGHHNLIQTLKISNLDYRYAKTNLNSVYKAPDSLGIFNP